MVSNTAAVTPQFRAIGTRPVRHDGVDKVTGRAQYGADLLFPGLIFGKVLRSPHAHARIKSVDASRALNYPGVLAVATAQDLAPVDEADPAGLALKFLSNNILAGDKVLYKGHAIAAVAAANVHTAEAALKLIEVQYEPLPPVIDVRAAMAADAPVLHPQFPNRHPDENGPLGPNVAEHHRVALGDTVKGFRKADLVLEQEFHIPTVHQGYIEPQNATAWWVPDGQKKSPGGRLTIWCSSQAPFGIRTDVALVLGITESSVRVVPMEIGGGFGGKLSAYLEPVAAVLSQKSGRPVKITMTRSEVLEATGPNPGACVRVKIGVTKSGRIIAAEGYVAMESGAYPGAFVAGAIASMFTPYDIANVIIDAYGVVNNKPKSAPYRAPGAPIVSFPVETVIDQIAETLGIDPVELRLANTAYEGTRRADGTRNPPIGCREVLEAVKEHPHYTAPLGTNQGRGVAVGFWRNNTGSSSVIVNVAPDGAVGLVTGSVDIGGSRVSLALQLAESLEIAVEDVNPRVADTDTIGYTSNTSGSGVEFKTGWAVYEAAQDVRDQMRQRAALVWDTDVDRVEYDSGVLLNLDSPGTVLTFKELAAELNNTGGPVVGRGNLSPKGVGGSATATILDVEVDPETGKISVVRATAFQDAGRAVHPSYVEGQIQGGTAQGIGWALNEEYVMSEDGALLNTSFLDYRMPTSLDLPMIDAVIIEVPNPGHPYGVRGVGEGSIIPPLAAVANAVYQATGKRFRSLPISPGRVLEALQDKETEQYDWDSGL